MADFNIYQRGMTNICLLTPNTEASRAWISENIPEDADRDGDAVQIRLMFVESIIGDIQDDGLIVERGKPPTT